MGLPCKLQKPPDTGPSYYYHYRSNCCPPFKLPYPVNLILLLMLAPLILLSLLTALKVPWLPLDWMDLNLMSCAVNAAILTVELSNVRLFHRTNICSPPFRMLYQMKLVQLLLLTSLLMLRLVILLKVPWLHQEWMDPHLLNCSANILHFTTDLLGILLFIYEHIPRQVLKFGYAKDHLIIVEFNSMITITSYLHCSKSSQVSKTNIDTRALLRRIREKNKTSFIINCSTKLIFMCISFYDERFKLDRDLAITVLMKAMIIVANIIFKL